MRMGDEDRRIERGMEGWEMGMRMEFTSQPATSKIAIAVSQQPKHEILFELDSGGVQRGGIGSSVVGFLGVWGMEVGIVRRRIGGKWGSGGGGEGEGGEAMIMYCRGWVGMGCFTGSLGRKGHG